MKYIQVQKQQRYARLSEFLGETENEAVIASVPKFAEDVELLDEGIADLKRLAEQQLSSSEGKTAVKAEARVIMSKAVLELASRIRLFAVRSGDKELAIDVKVTKTELLHRREVSALTRARKVITIARKVQPAMLTDYKLKVAMIDEVETSVNEFEASLNGPALAIDNKAVTTEALDEAITRLSDIVTNRINLHVDTLRRTNPEFAAAYDQINTLEKRRATHGSDGEGDAEAALTVETSAAPAVAGSRAQNGSGNTSAAHYLNGTGNGNGNGSRLHSPELIATELAR
jgi:hypothetical protein